jgi:TolB-like protein/DNA-binding winged helix-turn-helix (wHTH) protein/predicted Zn-dependent protease
MSVEVREFEEFELDPRSYCLSRGGEAIRLERIPLKLLCLLVERCGQVVTREEILARVWGKDVFIDSEHAINTAVRKLRRALNDDADRPRFIVTIPGKGYRFIAPVLIPNGESESGLSLNSEPNIDDNGLLPTKGKPTAFPFTAAAPDQNQPRRRRYWLVGLLSVVGLALITSAAVVVHSSHGTPAVSASKTSPELQAPQLPNQPSIAVLPFANLSGDREQEYFSDGITDDLITDLARLPGLLVIARESTFTYKGKVARLQEVSRELGVKYVLAGSVRKAAGQLRITAQLADATTGVELWAERYNRPLRDIFALQDEIVRRIVTTLHLELALAQKGLLIPRSTENLEAYDDLLRGMEYLLRFTKEGNAKARPLLEKTIELDPRYAWAYAALGANFCVGWTHAFTADPRDLEQASKMEQRAIVLDDSLSFAHGEMGLIYTLIGRHDDAITEVQRAIALDPNSALGYFFLAEVLNDQIRRPAEALAAVRKAMRLDPRNPDNYLWQQGRAYALLGRWKESIFALKRDLDHEDNLWAHGWLAFDYSSLGDDDGARAETAEIKRVLALSRESSIAYQALALALIGQDKPTEALIASEKASRLDPRYNYTTWTKGWAYSQQGQVEQAIGSFERDVADYPSNFWAHALLAADYIEFGNYAGARAEAAEALRLNPQLTVAMIAPAGSLIDKAHPVESERFRADLRKAGLK